MQVGLLGPLEVAGPEGRVRTGSDVVDSDAVRVQVSLVPGHVTAPVYSGIVEELLIK